MKTLFRALILSEQTRENPGFVLFLDLKEDLKKILLKLDWLSGLAKGENYGA